MVFADVINQVLVLFILLVIGFAAQRTKILNETTTAGLSGLLLKVAIPALIIDSLQVEFTTELLKTSGSLMALAFLVHGFSGLLAFPIGKMLKVSAGELGVYRFALVFSNARMIGYAVIRAVFGEGALFHASIYTLPFNLLIFTLGILLINGDKGEGERKYTAGMFINSATVAVLVGFLFFLFSVRLPAPLATVAKQLGSTTTPLSMLLIGAQLGGSNIGAVLRNKSILVVGLLRLLVMPLVVWLMLSRFLHDPLLIGVPTMLAAMPVAVNTVLVAQEYEADVLAASQLVFVTTLLSLLTIPLVAYLLV